MGSQSEVIPPISEVLQQPTPQADSYASQRNIHDARVLISTPVRLDNQFNHSNTLSSINNDNKKISVSDELGLSSEGLASPLMEYDFSNIRVCSYNDLFLGKLLNSSS